MNEAFEKKANYCLNCKIKPCELKGCPLGNHIPEMIKLLKEKKYKDAYIEISKTTVLPGVCGRICPHMKQCQGVCVRGIKGEPVSIGDLEAFTFDKANELGFSLLDCYGEIKKVNKKVAVVGGGPAGLTCAAFLAKEGIDVTIYEKYNELGGILVHGIPEFRLSKEVVKDSIQKILDLGVKVEYNQNLGDNLKLEDLLKEYDYIFLAIGANVSSKMGIEGENLVGVYGGNELLEYKNHPDYHGKIVLVNGGGNVAMDTARTIKRLGAKEVKVVYRRAKEQMPAEEKEINDAINEGIEFLFQNNIVKIIGNEKVEKVELIKTELVQKEGESRLSPVDIQGSNYEIDADYVIMALGSRTDNLVKDLNLNLTTRNYIEIDENYKTSNHKIFAGGDIVGGRGSVAKAARDGRNVAEQILEQIL